MPRLLALDLDGTLVRSDGVIDPRDADAIQRARKAGVTVTIATGRLTTGALVCARALDLDAPLICVDGAVFADPRSGAPIEQRALDLEVVEGAMRTLVSHDVVPFVFMHDSIHCDADARDHHPYVTLWTHNVVVHPRLLDAEAWRRRGEIAIAFGLGHESAVASARGELGRAIGDHAAIDSFDMGGVWGLRAQPHGCSKGEALARLAKQLGVARDDVAAVGDWYNDLSMLSWAGRSFAMGQAPEPVRAAATDSLKATAATGGGVAEALERWLSAG